MARWEAFYLYTCGRGNTAAVCHERLLRRRGHGYSIRKGRERQYRLVDLRHLRPVDLRYLQNLGGVAGMQ